MSQKTGLQKTSEVRSDLIIELSDLNYLCSHASLACKCFPEMIDTDDRTNYDPLTCVASPQVKMTSEFGGGRVLYSKSRQKRGRLPEE